MNPGTRRVDTHRRNHTSRAPGASRLLQARNGDIPARVGGRHRFICLFAVLKLMRTRGRDFISTLGPRHGQACAKFTLMALGGAAARRRGADVADGSARFLPALRKGIYERTRAFVVSLRPGLLMVCPGGRLLPIQGPSGKPGHNPESQLICRRACMEGAPIRCSDPYYRVWRDRGAGSRVGDRTARNRFGGHFRPRGFHRHQCSCGEGSEIH